MNTMSTTINSSKGRFASNASQTRKLIGIQYAFVELGDAIIEQPMLKGKNIENSREHTATPVFDVCRH